MKVDPAARHAAQARQDAFLHDAEAHRQMVAQFQQYERSFRRDYPLVWWSTLLGPGLITALAAVVIYFVCGGRFLAALSTASAIAFFVAGRFVIPLEGFGEWSQELSPEIMFWLVTYQDVLVALFMAFHVGYLFRVPWIGPKIAELTIDGELIISRQPWMRQVTFLGLVAFIAFPLAATGSVGGAIFGRLLGLKRGAIFWGSAIGGALGNAGMLFLSRIIKHYLPENSAMVRWGGVVIIVVLIIWLERRYAAMKREFIRGRQATQELGQPIGSDLAASVGLPSSDLTASGSLAPETSQSARDTSAGSTDQP
jgi:hypothetical protein